MRKKGVFYGWIVCGVCTLLIFITMGTTSNLLPVFMPYIMKTYGLTNAQTSSLVTLRCVASFIAMLVIGKYYDRIGFRLGTGLAALMCAGAYLIYSFSTGYIHFCLGAAAAGLSYGFGSMIPVSILMNRWFYRHRALTIGICGTGSGIATIVMAPLMTSLILKSSLRSAFLITASYAIISAIIITFLLREKPSDKGLEPLGREEMLSEYRAQGKAGQWQPRKLGRKNWFLLGGVSLLMGALAGPGYMHMSLLFTDEGIRPMTIALFMSVTGIVMTVFKVIFGQSADKLGGYRSSAIFLLFLLAGHVLCCFAFLSSTSLTMTTGVLLGVGYPIATVGIPVWTSDMVSQEHYSDVVRKLQLLYAGGAMAFATVPGLMADHFGNYISVYIMFVILLGASFAALTFAYRQRSVSQSDQ